MKKGILLLVTLALVVAMLSGCAMLPVLMGMLDGEEENGLTASGATKEVEVEDGEVYELSGEMSATESMLAMDSYYDDSPAGLYYYDDRDFNTEEYAALKEKGFTNVSTSPLSTFSADVDTASYCNLRRMINSGYGLGTIDSGAVRIEEMLNYFRYDYAAPKDGERFGVSAQIADCPWNPSNKLLMLGVRAADAPKAADEGSNLVFLVDVSGSMGDRDKLDLAKKALTMLTENLTDKDTLSIVTYSDGEDIIIEGANPVKDRTKLIAAIDSLEARGYTDGQRGLEQAYEVAMRYYRPHGNNRVIMCSDGDLNVGITSTSDLHDYVSGKKETGVYLSVLGFGAGNYKDTKMETLADDGNGNYYYIDSILEAQKVLVEEMTQTLYSVADDVKFQVEFNPAKVAQYRQIGYENRALANEDFEDDAKDAGEVGAGATVTVLYELVPAGDGEAQGDLKYQSSTLTEAAQGNEWLTVSVRYKEHGGEKSVLESTAVGDDDVAGTPSDDFLFASAVAEFGMILRDSEYKGSSDFASVLALLKQTELSDAYREEFFSLVKIVERNWQLSENER